MRTFFVTAIILSSVLGVTNLLYELHTNYALESVLLTNTPGLPPNSKTLDLIADEQKFINSQLKALKKRENRIPNEVLRYFCLLASASLFLSVYLKSKLEYAITEALAIFPKFNMLGNMKEGMLISIITTFIFASVFGDRLVTVFLSSGEIPAVSALFYTLLCLFIFPTLYLLIRKLLCIYSDKLVIACYMAYFIKATSEFITLDDVNPATMKSVDISEFSPAVRDYLIERRLQNRVYSERIIKSQNINAALIGWGIYERIEIYGDYRQLTNGEFDAVLMHEIGHSQDYSLIKKVSVLFALKALEMLFILYIYNSGSKKFADGFMTRQGAFIVLFTMYMFFLNKWLLMAHKLVSQAAETAADSIAKTRGYGKELSKVLYDITLKGETNLQTTWLFNSLKSYHPTIYNRIEHLRA